MNLTKDNYFSPEANAAFMSASQFKSFCKCEAETLARLRLDYPEPAPSKDMLIGSYVDAYFSGELDSFRDSHPEIFSSRGASKGQLKAEFSRADDLILRIIRDPMMMRYLSGEPQRIMTGEIEGVPFKIKMDSYHPGKCIADLKVVKDFHPIYDPVQKKRVHFIEYWGYDIQGAIYQAVEGHRLPFYIVAITKEPEPDICIYQIPQERLDICLEHVKAMVLRFQALKYGKLEPVGCGDCGYCRSIKVLHRVINYQEEEI